LRRGLKAMRRQKRAVKVPRWMSLCACHIRTRYYINTGL
jgi:hypothetical protein